MGSKVHDETSTEKLERPPSQPKRCTTLVFLSAREARRLDLGESEQVVVGRAEPADLVLDDRTLSRRHARIAVHDNQVRVVDLDSTNGLWQWGTRVPSAVLSPDAPIQLGEYTVLLHGAPGADAPQGTGLLSFGQLKVKLAEEITRSHAFGRPVTLVLLRPACSAVGPREPSWLGAIHKSARPVDTAAAYGPHTLAMLLPETDIGNARTRLAALARKLGHEMRAGLAAYPHSASNAEALVTAAREALHNASDRTPLRAAAEPRDEPETTTTAMVVQSQAMRNLLNQARRAARSHLSIVLYGETGTGKELIAREIHRQSPRADQRFCPVNCAALPATLMESALFGHERGAFTGANHTQPGLFEQADGGTLFLDEVGELSLAAQAALLRVLETGCVRRLGAARDRNVNVRVLAATHRNLVDMTSRGEFREDLFHRLAVVTLTVPPLRERSEEIAALATRFLANPTLPDDAARKLDDEALAHLLAYEWPGNVRQLRNALERAAVLALGETITVRDLPELVRPGAQESPTSGDDTQPDLSLAGSTGASIKERVRAYEVELIRRALAQTGGHRANAAKLLRMPLRTLMKRLDEHNLG